MLSGDEAKGAVAFFPIELQMRTVHHYDPLPPEDSVCDYTRPSSENGQASQNRQHSLMGSFFQSLLPNYDPVSWMFLVFITDETGLEFSNK